MVYKHFVFQVYQGECKQQTHTNTRTVSGFSFQKPSATELLSQATQIWSARVSDFYFTPWTTDVISNTHYFVLFVYNLYT